MFTLTYFSVFIYTFLLIAFCFFQIIPSQVVSFCDSPPIFQIRPTSNILDPLISKSKLRTVGSNHYSNILMCNNEHPKFKLHSLESYNIMGKNGIYGKLNSFLFKRSICSLLMLVITIVIYMKNSLSHVFASETLTTLANNVPHLHIGQRIAKYFQYYGLPDLPVLAIISALPVVELRGAVPVGLLMGLPLSTVFPVCILGNMLPIVPIMLILKNKAITKQLKPLLKRVEKKSSSFGVGSLRKQWISLALFVGIPLPGTGAWTGAMGSVLLGMPTVVALSSIFTGVALAGIIMAVITLAGKTGGIVALTVLAVVTVRSMFSKKRN